MIEINLAPGVEGRRATTRRRVPLRSPAIPAFSGDPRLIALGAVVVLLVLVIGFEMWHLGNRREALDSEIAVQVQDSTRFATTIALVQSLEARQDTMGRKMDVIREVDQRRYVWPHLLDEVSAAVPAYTWLTHIQAIEPTDTLDRAPAFSLEGDAGSTQALTRFMKNLEASVFIRDVTLITSEQQVVNSRTIQQFTLQARYQAPDTSDIVTIPIISIN